MAIPLALMAVGTGIKILGQYGANLQQSIAERENEAFFREQAQYAEEAAARAEGIAAYDYSHKIGEQLSAYAGSGVDMSGSAELTVGSTISNALGEIQAIKKKGYMDAKLARLRGAAAGRQADMLSSPTYNLLQAGGTGLSAWASMKG